MMANYPITVATLPAVHSRTIFGTALVKTWVSEMMAFQKDYVSTIGSFGTLASYYSVIRDATGNIKVDVVSHGAVVSQSASQHHNRIHGQSHLSSDAMRFSQDGYAYYKGIMSKQQFSKVAGMASGSNTGRQDGGYYNGIASDQWTVVAIGYRPKYLSMMMRAANSRVYEFYDRTTWIFAIENDNATLDFDILNTINFCSTGFKVYGDFNRPDRTYYYLAIGAPT